MRLLGDEILGTQYPLVLRFGVTSEMKERRGVRSKHLVRIESVEMSVAGKPIRNKRDQNIAFGLMLQGGWEEAERVEMAGDRIVATACSCAPKTCKPHVGFDT